MKKNEVNGMNIIPLETLITQRGTKSVAGDILDGEFFLTNYKGPRSLQPLIKNNQLKEARRKYKEWEWKQNLMATVPKTLGCLLQHNHLVVGGVDKNIKERFSFRMNQLYYAKPMNELQFYQMIRFLLDHGASFHLMEPSLMLPKEERQWVSSAYGHRKGAFFKCKSSLVKQDNLFLFHERQARAEWNSSQMIDTLFAKGKVIFKLTAQMLPATERKPFYQMCKKVLIPCYLKTRILQMQIGQKDQQAQLFWQQEYERLNDQVSSLAEYNYCKALQLMHPDFTPAVVMRMVTSKKMNMAETISFLRSIFGEFLQIQEHKRLFQCSMPDHGNNKARAKNERHDKWVNKGVAVFMLNNNEKGALETC